MEFKKRMLLMGIMVSMSTGCATLQLTSDERSSIRQAAQEALPSGVRVNVSTKSRFLSKADLVIAVHLLEGHSSDEQSPYVRGDYGTHEKLTRLVRLRSAKVIKAILDKGRLPDVGGIVVHTKHGVRQSYVGKPYSGTNVAMNLYTVRFELISSVGERSVFSEEYIINRFTVQENIIPSLSFGSSY